MLASLQAKLIAGAVIFLLVFGMGYKLRDYQADSDALEAANKAAAAMTEALSLRDARESSYAIKSRNLENIIADLRVSKQKVQIIRERIYAKNPAYSTCVLPDDGRVLLNERIAQRNSSVDTGKREDEMP